MKSEFSALLGILRRRHRIVGLEPEALAILCRRQIVPDREVALQDLFVKRAIYRSCWTR